MRALECLVSAIGRGSALAALSMMGCSGETTTDVTNAGGAGTGGASQSLDPYSPDALGCAGPHHDGGYFGQCCVSAHCYEPESGASCLPGTGADRSSLPNLPPGSGTCTCGPIEGPFAPNPADEPRSPGRCCYLVGSISCEGRPFLVDAVALTAPIVRRSDWASSVT